MNHSIETLKREIRNLRHSMYLSSSFNRPSKHLEEKVNELEKAIDILKSHGVKYGH